MLCIDETKLDATFPHAQFHIEGYQYSQFRRDRDKNGGVKMIFIREGLRDKDCMHTKITPPKLHAWKSQFLKRNSV